MVTIKHEIPAGTEFRYADHNISERPGPILKGILCGQPEQPHPPAQPQISSYPSARAGEPMNPEAARHYSRQYTLLEQRAQSSSADYQLQLQLLELQNLNRRYSFRKALGSRVGQQPKTMQGSLGESSLVLDEHRQLCLLEAQSKKRLQLARLEQAYAESAGRGQKSPFRVPESYWGHNSEAWERDYERQMMIIEQQNEEASAEDSEDEYSVGNAQYHAPHTGGSHALKDYQMRLIERQTKQRNERAAAEESEKEDSAGNAQYPQHHSLHVGGNHALKDYQMQLREHHTKQQKERAVAEETAQYHSTYLGGNHALKDYQMQLKLQEQRTKQQNEKAAAEEIESAQYPQRHSPHASRSVPLCTTNNYALQDYQTQMMLLERQTKNRITANQATGNGPNISASPLPYESFGHSAPQMYTFAHKDHTELEQSMSPEGYTPFNNFRVEGPSTHFSTSHGGMPNANSAMPGSLQNGTMTNPHPFVSGPSHCLQDYEMQLMLLEQQNKKRLLLARLEQDAMIGARAEQSGPLEARATYLPGTAGASCSPAPSSIMFTPEPSVAPPPENQFNGRSLALRGSARRNDLDY